MKAWLEGNHKAILSLGAIATVLITLSSVWTVHKSNEGLLETNERLLETNERLVEKMPPIEPSLRIVPEQNKEDLVFGASYLANIQPTQTGELVRSDVELRFTIKNIGQMGPGRVHLKLFGDWILIRRETMDLGGLDSGHVEFRIWYEKCSVDDPIPCVAENVPTGPQNLTLEVTCYMCSNRTFSQPVEICVEHNGTECDDWLEN
jgi:hypothetical protein